MQNHFELFQLPQRFSIDMTDLEQAYREVQGRVHPDRFAQAGAAEQRVALQWATQANEAYQTLKHPVRRARYLVELAGVDLEMESNTAMPAEFLMQQMEWMEAFDAIRQTRDEVELIALEREVLAEKNNLLQHFSSLLDQQQFVEAGKLLRQQMFLQKLAEDIAQFSDK